MSNSSLPSHWSPANRSDINTRIEASAEKLAESGRTAFSHLEILGEATTQRPFPAPTVTALRQMIADGELIASIDADGVQYLRDRKVSDFVINRIIREPSRRLSEIQHLTALSITLPHLKGQAA